MFHGASNTLINTDGRCKYLSTMWPKYEL